MYENVKMNWMGFGCKKSKVKGHRVRKCKEKSPKYLDTCIQDNFKTTKQFKPNLA